MNRLMPLVAVILSTFAVNANAQFFDEHPVFNSYLADNPPIVDGIISLNEWAAAGEPIVVDSNSPYADSINPSLNGHPFGGDEDLSFQFRSMWVAPWDIYFLVEINDNIAMEESFVTDRPWQRDQLEFFLDGDQLTGGNIRWWDTNPGDPIDSEDTAGPGDPIGKLAFPRPNENGEQRPFDGQTGKMSADPEDVGQNGIIASGIATETGVNANYFVELHVSMQDAMENGLFEGTPAGEFGTMVPDTTALKFSMFVSDNDNTAADVANDDGRTHGAGIPGGGTVEGPVVEGTQFFCTETKLNGAEICGLDDWWRSDKYPNLLLADAYIPEVTGPACDFDGSGTCDIGDLNELMYSGLSSGDSKYDLDNSGTVDLGDRDAFLREIGSLPGDSNADGVVNATDLNALGANWQADGLTSWSQGDFDGNGIGNAADLNIVGGNWQKTSADFAGAAAPLSAAAVPEPTSLTLLLFCGFGVLGLRCR